MNCSVGLLLFLVCTESFGQSLLSGSRPDQPPRLFTSDAMILELKEPRHDFSCTITPLKPQLGLDLIFHTGYRITVPMRELAGAANLLTIIFRVTPANRSDEPVYLSHQFRVPFISESQSGDATLNGAFLVGIGRYHVEWLMRDSNGRYCAAFWDIEGKPGRKEAVWAQSILRDRVQAVEDDPPAYESIAAGRRPDALLNVKVIVNFSPPDSEGAASSSRDLSALLAILRRVGREPRIGGYSIIACSLQTQQVIYRQPMSEQIDLVALEHALAPANFATVSINQLKIKDGWGDFFGKLIVDELGKDRAIALIMVSPDCTIDLRMSPETLNKLRDLPVFYLNYKVDRSVFTGGDTIGRVVKAVHGFEYTISQPRDLFTAWSDILSRIGQPEKRP